jgi:dienelactone hydrolase
MKKSTLLLLITTCLLSMQLIAQQKTSSVYDQKIIGYWQGVLSAGGQKFHITFNIQKNDKDSLIAKLSVKEQLAKEMPMDRTLLNDSALTIISKAAGIRYEGVLNLDSMKIKGTWKQGKGKFPFDLTLNDTIKVVKHPQEPLRPFPYKEEDVSFSSTGGAVLAGTLTYPSTGGNFPAVIMVTGSGPQNRDEEILGHKPFLVISDYLTRHGIAVLRFDDRGTAASTGDFTTSTSKDFADDAMAGVKYLLSNKLINPKKIGVMGHSEGGLIAPMLAANSSDVAFIVMLAGPGVSGDKILELQGELIGRTEKISEDTLKMNLELDKKIYAVIKKVKNNDKAGKKIRKLIMESLPDSLKNDLKTSLEMGKQIATLTSPWMRYFLSYDPQKTLSKVKCPVLALNGKKDMQVPATQNIPEIEKALKKAGNKDYTIKEMPGLNHLFQHCKTGSPDEYADIEETFSPDALDLITNWILKH